MDVKIGYKWKKTELEEKYFKKVGLQIKKHWKQIETFRIETLKINKTYEIRNKNIFRKHWKQIETVRIKTKTTKIQ